MTTPSPMRQRIQPSRPRPGGDRGSVTVELALGVPVLVLMLFLVVGAFRLARATIDVNSAAAAAARAASIARTNAAARNAAADAAAANLAGRCNQVSATVDTGQFHRGGAVTVHVACTVTTHGLLGIGLPGEMTVSASSTSPLDLYRNAS